MRKMFRNCPNENCRNCIDCIGFNICMKKKARRRVKRGNILSIRNVCKIAILVIIIIISTVIIKEKRENTNIRILSPEEVAVKEEDPKLIKSFGISENGPKEDYYYHINNRDKKIIEKVVYEEARGEKLEGKVAVAAVVLNRYYSKYKNFKGKSIKTLVTQQNQFADISKVTQDMLNEYPDCKKAVEMALKGWDPTRRKFSKGAKYFFQPELISETEKIKRQGIKIMKIGNHCFHDEFSK